MTRALRTAVTALLLTLTSLAFTAQPASAAACRNTGGNTVSGGYVAVIYCSGPGTIHGFGSTVAAANANAQQLYQLYVNTGYNCDGRDTLTASGGYEVVIYCVDRGVINGFGSTLTAAAEEARQLMLHRRATGNACDGRGAFAVPGGYEVVIWCPNGGFINGFGSTLTAAAGEARQLDLHRIATGNACDGRAASAVSGGYGVVIWCSRGGFINGVGSTLTAAAINARLAAN